MVAIIIIIYLGLGCLLARLGPWDPGFEALICILLWPMLYPVWGLSLAIEKGEDGFHGMLKYLTRWADR